MPKKKAAKKQASSSENVPVRRSSSGLPISYPEVLEGVKARIRAAQIKASLSVNRELISLYWDIGETIVRRQKMEGWGRSVVERLSTDIQKEFPGIRGFSPQNLWHMRSLFLAWTETENLQQAVGEIDGENLPQAVGEIPWGHNLQLLSKLDDPAKRLWYARQPAIGLIVCKDRSKTIVEYTLRDANKPMGVSTYTTVPPKYRGELPTQNQLAGLLKRSAEKEAT
jgi:predicted nuclease of restriction endonuclease-like (RecB) superfamily